MSAQQFTEDRFEESVVTEIEELGYQYIPGQYLVRPSLKSVIAEEVLMESLQVINPHATAEVLNQAATTIKHIDAGLLVNRNETFFEYLKNGIEVPYYEDGEQKTDIVKLIDADTIENNSFVVTNQLTILGKDQKRPDIIVFLNGLPIIVIELKTARSETVDISNAYRQIKNYQHDIEELFVYNAFNIISDHTQTKVGTITADEAWYKAWKSVEGEKPTTGLIPFDVAIKGLMDKERLLDILMNFIFFEHKKDGTSKILAQYHQYYAVHKARVSTVEAIQEENGRGGVFWHTQGSGKSLSMVFYTQLMTQTLDHPTFVILTDRNDLDDQLYGQFARAKQFLRQNPVQAKDRQHLKELLNKRQSNGIFFSTMQKFAESEEPLTDRSDVIVMTDEAHRSQYGLREKVSRDGKIQHGMARLVRQSLPHATYIGFTGTPLSESDKDTQAVFGSYIDVYDMTQAVDDGATKPVYYENRVINLGLNDSVLKEIDAKYGELANEADETTIEKSKQELSRLNVVLGSDKVINTLVDDILSHYEQNRSHLLTGKAMIVAYDRSIAIKIYQRILELRPNWDEKVKVVMTGNNNDPEEWKQLVGNKSDRDELARKFKDNDDPMKIAIVVDMWLTGFDVPSLATMYVFKPMKGHNLMQAIARVNRVFQDKEGGLVVDYIGIAGALREAMSNYTKADQKSIKNADIADSAYPTFLEKLEVVRNVFFNNFSYSKFFSGTMTSSEQANLIANGTNHILAKGEHQVKQFRDEALALNKAHTLCSSITNKNEQREAAFFEAVRIGVNRVKSSEKLSKKEINDQITALLEQSVQSDGVINLFKDFEEGFSLFDPNFLEKIDQMKQKNLSVELLNKLLKDEVKAITRTDIVKGREFSERLRSIMESYRSNLIDNADSLDQFTNIAHQVAEDDDKRGFDKTQATLQQLIELARETIALENENKQLGLNSTELAFYHTLSDPEQIGLYFKEDELKELTRELTQEISDMITPDWTERESGKANVRKTIKRFLKRKGYPAEYVQETITLILKQAENLGPNIVTSV